MQRYLDVSTQIYKTYLKYVSPADIYPYSIDEVFIDVTGYLPYYQMSAHELAMTMVREVLCNTGITATAGIGTNLYLAKLAMDIVAKHIPADKDGVRIAELDEQSYRYLLWNHRPLTDFWMTGPGTVKRLEAHGIYTMGTWHGFLSMGKIVCMRFSAWTRKFSSTTHGVMSPAAWPRSKATSPAPTASARGRC